MRVDFTNHGIRMVGKGWEVSHYLQSWKDNPMKYEDWAREHTTPTTPKVVSLSAYLARKKG